MTPKQGCRGDSSVAEGVVRDELLKGTSRNSGASTGNPQLSNGGVAAPWTPHKPLRTWKEKLLLLIVPGVPADPRPSRPSGACPPGLPSCNSGSNRHGDTECLMTSSRRGAGKLGSAAAGRNALLQVICEERNSDLRLEIAGSSKDKHHYQPEKFKCEPR